MQLNNFFVISEELQHQSAGNKSQKAHAAVSQGLLLIVNSEAVRALGPSASIWIIAWLPEKGNQKVIFRVMVVKFSCAVRIWTASHQPAASRLAYKAAVSGAEVTSSTMCLHLKHMKHCWNKRSLGNQKALS